MEITNSALSGLRPITIGDLKRYKTALNACRRTGWQHYFPFMYCFSQDPPRQILFEEQPDSICVYLLQKEQGVLKLFLYFLPMPINMSALRRAVERVQNFNATKNAVIYWVDAEDLGLFDTIPTSRIIALDREYLYSPDAFKSMAGRETREFRHNLARMHARDDIQIRPYTANDADDCLRLLALWTEQQSAKYEYIRGHDYTKACIRLAPQFGQPDLFGLVVLVGGEIRSFGFGGEMRAGLGNIFITKSDRRIKGINQFLIYHLVLGMGQCERVNSSTATSPGLQHAKEALCPVSMHPMFRVHLS